MRDDDVARLVEELRHLRDERGAHLMDVADVLERVEAERQRLEKALGRIANDNDPLYGIGSEMDFAREVLASLDQQEEPTGNHAERSTTRGDTNE